MPFDFDQIIDRRNTNSYKWDVKADELPMWVADMDFGTAPAVVDAIEKRIRQGAFGYNTVPDTFRESIIRWWQRRHQYEMEKEWILYCTGVVPAISSIVRKMTEIGDDIVVLAPVYNIFYNSILNNGRKVLASELRYEDESYAIDYADLEEKLSRETTSLFIFCNPHNPIGKVWDLQTLERIAELMQAEGFPAEGHDIGDTFEFGPAKITLTPADHAWQNEKAKYNYRVFRLEDYCGFWIETPDGIIWAPGDSRLMKEHLEMPQPDAILFDFSDNEWHIGLEGAIQMANTYPEAHLILCHWGTVDAPDLNVFNADPQSLYDRVVNPERIHAYAPGQPFSLRKG